MEIIPAIDIQDSKVVRLTKGDFNSSKVYSSSPVQMALYWQKQGAKKLHLIDLDGAREGKLKNITSISEILNSCSLKVQVGGGIRDRKIAEDLLSLGVNKIILGTVVKENFKLFSEIIKDIEEHIIVAVDAKDDKIVSRGWVKQSDISYIDFIKTIEETKISTIIYTDVQKDGTLTEPNYKAIEKILSQSNISLIASGGISSIIQLERLYKLQKIGLEGLILGKALYEGKINFRECIKRFAD